MSLKNLLDCITGNTKTTDSVRSWKSILTRSIPDWEEIIEDISSWNQLEKTLAAKDHDSLYKIVLDIAGVELAKRWFSSGVDSQSRAAERWSLVELEEWDDFTDDMKMYVIKHSKAIKLIRLLDHWRWEDLTDELKAELIDRITWDFDYKRSFGKPSFIDDCVDPRSWDSLTDELKTDLFHYICWECSKYAYLIEKKLNFLKEAGDKQYLRRFNKQLKGLLPEVQDQQHRETYSPDKYENRYQSDLIARLMQKAIRNGYSPSALPQILVSSETPPIFITYPELDDDEYYRDSRRPRIEEKKELPRDEDRINPEKISIENLLGVYKPWEQQIIIYEKGIKWWCRRHVPMEDWLFSVVLVHELAHWITHLLPKPGTRTWPTELYVQGETDLHEGWAQLMTYWIAEEIKGPFKHVFEELNKDQPNPYLVFKQFQNQNPDKIMSSLEKLRALTVPAGLNDWKNAI